LVPAALTTIAATMVVTLIAAAAAALVAATLTAVTAAVVMAIIATVAAVMTVIVAATAVTILVRSASPQRRQHGPLKSLKQRPDLWHLSAGQIARQSQILGNGERPVLMGSDDAVEERRAALAILRTGRRRSDQRQEHHDRASPVVASVSSHNHSNLWTQLRSFRIVRMIRSVLDPVKT
jgi:hypothetical protein